MAILQSSQILRQYDSRSGHNIKTFYDSSSAQIQAMVMVDDEGDLISSQHTIGNGNGLDVNIRTLNGQASDSFGRMRVSELYSMFESTSRYDIDDSSWTTLGTDNAGTVAHDPVNATIKLETTAAIDDNAVLTSIKNFRYQPGKSQLVMQTLSIVNPTEVNCDRRWGYFDGDNGLFWGIIDGVFGVGIRNNGTETFIPQENFNRDKLDGTGDLGLAVDLTKSQIYYISFQFLGVGIVEFGVYCRDGRIIPAHVFQNANSQTYSYMQTALLPLRYECRNDNTVAPVATCGINVLCATVNSESGSEPLYSIVNSISNDDFVDTTDASETPILSIRAKTAISGVRNKVEVVPTQLSIGCENKSVIIRLRENCNLTNSTFSGDIGIQSSIEYDTAATALGAVDLPNLLTNRLVETFVVNAGESEIIDLERIFAANKQSLTYNNANLQESLTITMQKVGSQGTEASVLSSLTWSEIR